MASLVAQTVKRLPIMWETWVQSLGREDLLEKEMATHSSILAWIIPWMEEPGKLQFMGSQRVGHNWATSLHFRPWSVSFRELESWWLHVTGNGNPLQCSCLENPRDGGAWWAAVCGVAQSWTRLKWLSCMWLVYSLNYYWFPGQPPFFSYIFTFPDSLTLQSALWDLKSLGN